MSNEWARQPSQPAALPDDHFTKPSPARMWNYLQGGKDNYSLDRAVGEAIAAVYPDMFEQAAQCRRFLARAVLVLARDHGVRQFLDIGCGLPAPEHLSNVHDVAQDVHPDARTVYVDNDKVVLAHARALLTPKTDAGVCAYLDADIRDIESILVAAAETLDFARPVAFSMLGVLATLPLDEAISIVATAMNSVPTGSFVVFDDGVAGGALSKGELKAREIGMYDYNVRTPEQMTRYFSGLELVEPGLVPVHQWRPDLAEVGTLRPVEAYGAVGRKP